MSKEVDKTASAEKMVKSIAALPPLPATALKILAYFGDDFIDADFVADVVKSDPGISARLLGLSNSAYYGLVEPVHSVREAISRVLGVDTVRSLVLAMAIQQSFNTRKCPAFDVRLFWMQSLLTAECCKKIARADSVAEDADRELAYSTGLFHNLGLMALAHLLPDRTHAVLSALKKKPQNLGELLVAEIETDHRSMTAELATAWTLPSPITAAYQHRADPENGCDDRLSLILASGVAAVGNREVEEEQRADLTHWAKDLGFAADDLQQMAYVDERKEEQLLSLVGDMSR